MAKLFNIDIAGIMNQALGSKLLPVVLGEPVAGVRDPLNPSAGLSPSTFTTHKSRGFVDMYAEKYFAKELVMTADKVVCVLGKPLGVDPVPGWEVMIEGESYRVVKVERDPARALFQLLCRGHT